MISKVDVALDALLRTPFAVDVPLPETRRQVYLGDGGELFVQEARPEQSTLSRALFVHGWGDNSGVFEALVKAIARLGYASILIDLPGHGRSAASSLTIPGAAEAIDRVLKRYPDIETVVGHSFGATALAYYGQMFGRFRRAVLIAPAMAFSHRVRSVADLFGLDVSDRDILLKRLADEGVVVNELDLRRRHAPAKEVLLIHDNADRVVPVEGSIDLASRWSDSQFVTTSGAGHRRIVSHPDTIEAVERFLLP